MCGHFAREIFCCCGRRRNIFGQSAVQTCVFHVDKSCLWAQSPISFSPRGTAGPNPFLFFTPISATYPLDGGYKAWASWIKIRPYRWNALSRCNTSSVQFDGFYVGGPNVFFGKQRGIKMCQSAGLKHKSARRLSSFYVSRHGEEKSGVWTLQNA